MEYFGGTGRNHTINERTGTEGCEYDNGYVSRQWICLQRGDRFISIAAGRRKVHEYQIGMCCVCLLYGFYARCRFNSVIAGLLEMEQQQSSNVKIVVNNEDLAPHPPRIFVRFQQTTRKHLSKVQNLSA
jgi:hypothetical protein